MPSDLLEFEFDAGPTRKQRVPLLRSAEALDFEKIMRKRKRIVHADTQAGQLAGEAIIEAIENQIRDNNPPETALTLVRLMKGGESRENAVRLIGCAMAVEVFEIVKNRRPFNERRYVEYLLRLPELPFQESDEN